MASGGPAGGQTFEKFDKQVLKAVICFTDVGKIYGSGLTSLPPLFFQPAGLRERGRNRKVFGAHFKRRPTGGLAE